MNDPHAHDVPIGEPRVPGPGGAWVAAIIVVAISLLSTFTIASPDDTGPATVGVVGSADPSLPETGTVTPVQGEEETTVRQVGGGEDVVVGGTEGSATGGSQTGGSGTQGAEGSYDCSKNQNAGASDVGVTSDSITFGATVVLTGIATDFLADAQWGIEAVVRKVNQGGGICGRQIKVDYDDDGWDPAAGTRTIKKWIGDDKHFGLVVNPSSEGLRGAIDGGHINQNEFPVVGADGMLIDQYVDAPWVWPIATSTYSVAHIMAADAAARGAKSFGIVWDGRYRFGVEGHAAFVREVERVCGSDCLKADQEVKAGATSYTNEANSFMGECGGDFANCDFVAVLLEPSTAKTWVDSGGLGGKDDDRPEVGIGAPQPLFVDSFIKNCDRRCANMWAWTSFKPPLFPYDSDPAVKEYVRDLRAVRSSADVSNPHVQGAYVGTKLLVHALEQLGPAPTRAKLRQVLDQTTFESGLAPPLKFTPGNHFAAVSAQAFRAIFNTDDFNNWEHVKDFTADKSVKADLDAVKP